MEGGVQLTTQPKTVGSDLPSIFSKLQKYNVITFMVGLPQSVVSTQQWWLEHSLGSRVWELGMEEKAAGGGMRGVQSVTENLGRRGALRPGLPQAGLPRPAPAQGREFPTVISGQEDGLWPDMPLR